MEQDSKSNASDARQFNCIYGHEVCGEFQRKIKSYFDQNPSEEHPWASKTIRIENRSSSSDKIKALRYSVGFHRKLPPEKIAFKNYYVAAHHWPASLFELCAKVDPTSWR